MNETPEVKLSVFGKLARTFVMNGKLTFLLVLSLSLWGILSFILTPKQYNPDIVAPAFQVITAFPGATESEVEELISKPMEDAVMDIEGVDEVMTQSLDGGLSLVTVKFFVGQNMEDSKIKLQQKFSSEMNRKPVGALLPQIKTIDPDEVPVLTLALRSNQMNPMELRQFTFRLQDELKLVKDTANVQVVGGRRTQLSVWLDAQKLNAYRLSLLDIQQAIQAANVRLLSSGLETDTRRIPVELSGTIQSANQLAGIVVYADESRRIYLKDIARITEEGEEVNNHALLKEKARPAESVVFLSVAKKKGSNIIKVTGAVNQRLEELKMEGQIPASISWTVLRDEGLTAQNEISGLVMNLFQAIVIVALVLFLFLAPRPAFIVAIVIPLTLGVVFGFGLLFGQTINRITLFALILSLGLLVDNATVVVENILRNVKGNQTEGIKDIAVRSVDEVGMGLFMSTVTTVLAFVPMAFVTGMMGPYMGPIPFFVPVALIASLFIAYTINPWLSSVLIKREEKSAETQKFSRLKNTFSSLGSKLMHGYRSLLHKLLHSAPLRRTVLGVTLLIFAVVMSFPVFQLVKFRMLPKADREQFYVYLDLPEKSVLKDTKQVVDTLIAKLTSEPNVVSVQGFVGMSPIIDFNGLFKGAEGRNNDYQATLKVNLTPISERDTKSEQLVLALRPKMKEWLKSRPDIRFKLIEDPPGPPVLSTLLAKVQGPDQTTLKAIGRDLEIMFAKTEGVEDVDSTIPFAGYKVLWTVDQEKATQSGLSATQIAQALALYLDGDKVGVYHRVGATEEEYIVARLEKEGRNSPTDLSVIQLKNRNGDMVPLSSLVHETENNNADILYRDGRQGTVYVMAEMGNRGVTYAVIDLMKDLWNYKLPSGQGVRTGFSLFGLTYVDQASGQSYQIRWGGEWELTLEVFRDLGLAMMIAIFLIYFVLVAQFRSFRTPLIVMGTIPLAMIGVMPGFALMGALKGLYFTATSMIGIIALAGIVVNNAIILLEYLNGLREKGYTAEMALIEAGSTRLRPILLTTATTILGSLTIIGDPVWAGLAWSIVFGLSVSAVLTLVIFPILYFVFEGNEWNCRLRQNSQANFTPHGPSLP